MRLCLHSLQSTEVTLMNTADKKLWLRALILAGLSYLVAGLGFGALAAASATNEMRNVWRLGAWLASAAAFALHMGYEYYRLRSSSRATASHVSGAVALGAFAVAIAANAHALWSGQGNQRLLLSALVLWPLVTAVPAYLLVWGLTTLLAHRKEVK